MQEPDTILYEHDDDVAVITLARPDKRNAMTLDMFERLAEVVEVAGSDAEIRAVVIAGAGPSFCAGIDLELLAQIGPLAAQAERDPEPFRSFVRVVQRPFLALARMSKPIVAAVQGHALGAGFHLALACDLRVGAADMSCAMLEARYGLIPDLGGMQHLVRLAGPAVAKELVWTTRTVEADEALRLGLVNAVVELGELRSRATELAHACVAHSPVAASLTKGLIDGVVGRPIDEELDLEADAQAAVIALARKRLP